MPRFFIFTLFLLLASVVQAQVQVAFFEVYDRSGKLVEFEPGGRFGHVAISFKGGWLHTGKSGVEWTPSVEMIGPPAMILENPKIKLDETKAEHMIGLKYDRSFNWSSSGMYCSKLVGLLLEITPKPMSFASTKWRGFKVTKGAVGLSPDDLAQELLRSGFVEVATRTCRQMLESLPMTGTMPGFSL